MPKVTSRMEELSRFQLLSRKATLLSRDRLENLNTFLAFVLKRQFDEDEGKMRRSHSPQQPPTGGADGEGGEDKS